MNKVLRVSRHALKVDRPAGLNTIAGRRSTPPSNALPAPTAFFSTKYTDGFIQFTPRINTGNRLCGEEKQLFADY